MQRNKLPRRLLVVEDNPTDALLLRRALTEHGVDYEMVVVGDGEEAIEYLETMQGSKAGADHRRPEPSKGRRYRSVESISRQSLVHRDADGDSDVVRLSQRATAG